ncbi:MAG: hypothetical protein JSV80_17730 [Acidobacteriota bacterium]|nr:MAG: hypothetical protein JSV80_17730 [Acidobacteriota bacterium]
MQIQDRVGASETGFSLAEVYVSLAVTAVILLGLLVLVRQNHALYHDQERLAETRQQARLALELMSRELKQIGSDPSGRAFSAGAEQLLVADQDEVGFQADRPQDINGDGDFTDSFDSDGNGVFTGNDEDERGDGVLDDVGESIWYRFDPNERTLARVDAQVLDDSSTPVRQIIAENVSAFRLRYFARDGLEMTPPLMPIERDGVARIEINMTIDSAEPRTAGVGPGDRRFWSTSFEADVVRRVGTL